MKHKTITAKIITVLLSAILMISTMNVVSFGDNNDSDSYMNPFTDGVDYINEKGLPRHLNRDEYKIYGIDTQLSDPLTSGWYVMFSSGSVSSRAEVKGDVKIILMAQSSQYAAPTIHFMDGISVPEGSTLSIYGQTTEKDKSGKLVADGSKFCAGIGADDSDSKIESKCGTINIYGGYIEANGGLGAAGIGGGYGWLGTNGVKHGGECGKFYMKDGWVYTTGGSHAAGLGGGYRGNSGGQGIVIDGGYIEARGGDKENTTADDSCGGAGIGGGEAKHAGEVGGCAENITINGGIVKAYGTDGGAGIGAGGYGNGSLDKKCWITINGGRVEAYGEDGGAGIGGGYGPLNDWFPTGAGANVRITGGSVYAKGSPEAAGIGASRSKNYGSGQTIIEGKADVTAIGGDYAAGIGTGNEPTWPASNITWNKLYDIRIGGNADVTAIGGKEGAAIGCGNEGLDSAGRMGDVTISGNAKVEAYGGKYGAGIGGGDQQTNGKVTISGGDIFASGGEGAAGIGSGDNTEDGAISSDISITGGTVHAVGGDYGAGIGGADGSDMNAKIVIDDNGIYKDDPVNEIKVIAEAEKEASGIGGGNYWTGCGGGNGCNVTIDLKNKNSYVLAKKDDDSAPIGHGDSGDSDGSLTLDSGNDGNYLSVKRVNTTKFNEANPTVPVGKDSRVAECQNEDTTAVLIQYCNDTPSAGQLKYTPVDEYDHNVDCDYCGFHTDERHTASQTGDHKCTKCGGNVETLLVDFKEGDPLETVSGKSIYVGLWAPYTLPNYDPNLVPEGKRFAGWNKEWNKDIKRVRSPGETVYEYKDDSRTWVAMYGAPVDITYKPGEGTGSIQTIQTVAGIDYWLPRPEDLGIEGPEGAKFIGWYDGTDTYGPAYHYELKEDVNKITFTAQWKDHEHSMIHYNEVAATCEKAGNHEYWECTKCSKLFRDSKGETPCTEDEIIITKRGHDWEAEPTYSWSDDNLSVTAEVICLNDPKHKITETVPAEVVTNEPTCLEAGSTVYTAAFTKTAFTTQVKTITIPKLEHSWPKTPEGVDIWESAGEGKEKRTCPVCNTTEEREAGHIHNLKHVEQKDPTCEKSGTREYWKCVDGENGKGCGKWYADEDANQEIIGETEAVRLNSLRIPALGHRVVSTSSEVIKEATCDEGGLVKVTRTCARQHDMQPQVLNTEPLGHDWREEVTKPATCTEAGLKEFKCRRCGATKDPIEIPALGGEHEWGDWVVTRAATETVPGEKQRTCENCGVVELMSISPTPVPPAASVTINSSTVSAKSLSAAVKKAGGTNESVTTIVLGKKVKKISKSAFKNYKNAKTLVVKTKKLKKAKVKKSLKGSKIKTIKVKVGKKKTNKKYVKKYKKIFTKKNAGKKVKVTL